MKNIAFQDRIDSVAKRIVNINLNRIFKLEEAAKAHDMESNKVSSFPSLLCVTVAIYSTILARGSREAHLWSSETTLILRTYRLAARLCCLFDKIKSVFLARSGFFFFNTIFRCLLININLNPHKLGNLGKMEICALFPMER